MAILTSLFSGVSGLNAFGTGLSVISNNIANMNTVGFTSGDVLFADVINQSLGGREDVQLGRGVFVNDIRTSFAQGSFESTGNGLDMSIEGEGFFVVKDSAGAEFFTRTGAFNLDANGLMVNPDGLQVQGFQADQTGVITGQFGSINLASGSIQPRATTKIDMIANLDSGGVIPAAFDVNNPAATSNFSTSITLHDSLGNSHLTTVYFRKSAEAATGNTWEYFAVVDAANSTSGAATIMANGTLGFGTDGRLVTESAITYPTGGFDFAGGPAQNQTITLDFGVNSGSEGGTGFGGVTQFGSTSAVLNQTQDGFGAGSLRNVAIDKSGIVTGLFTNGKSRTLAQISLARFNNAQGLNKLGDNLFTLSTSSGEANIGVPNAAGVGKILANTLELSNVDLAQQFVKMIEYQRGFQASSRVITTTDELLQELVNLKR
ncbi:MAG: flagellar hook protein FlgE [Nitrospiria bacterium]